MSTSLAKYPPLMSDVSRLGRAGAMENLPTGTHEITPASLCTSALPYNPLVSHIKLSHAIATTEILHHFAAALQSIRHIVHVKDDTDIQNVFPKCVCGAACTANWKASSTNRKVSSKECWVCWVLSCVCKGKAEQQRFLQTRVIFKDAYRM